MSEANFEKNVQMEMQGFKVKPSEEVWLKVEERIRKKKRRRIFFILFFAGLALLGYWQRDLLFSEKEPAITESVSTAPEEISSNEKAKSKEQDNLSNEIIVKESIEKVKTEIKNDMPIINKKQKSEGKQGTVLIKKESTPGNLSEIAKQETKKIQEEINTDQQKANIEKPAAMQVTTDASDLVKVITDKKEIENKEGLEISMDITVTKEKEKIIEKEIEKINEFKMPDENKVQIDSIQIVESKAGSLVDMKKLPAISKKWKWGVQVTPGVSSFNNKSFSLYKSLNTRLDALSGGPTPGVPPPFVPLAQPSKRKPGFAIKLGAFAQRKISSGLDLSVGLQYSYYSDQIRVGGRRDSVLNISPRRMIFSDASQVYAAANSSGNYTSHYHFLELPVRLYIRLNKNTTKPFYFNLGFTAGQMIAGNALVYDTAFRGIYYKSNKLFNKTQFSISPGFLWTIPGKKLQWSFGPDIDIHLNRFLNSSFESQKYLLVPGFKTRVLFPGKK